MATTANANPMASGGAEDIVVPEYQYSPEQRDVEENPHGISKAPTGALGQHRRAVKLQLWCAALVPFNILRHIRVLPSDAIACHFQPDGFATESPRLSYSAFLFFLSDGDPAMEASLLYRADWFTEGAIFVIFFHADVLLKPLPNFSLAACILGRP